jgi:hypothetical protein
MNINRDHGERYWAVDYIWHAGTVIVSAASEDEALDKFYNEVTDEELLEHGRVYDIVQDVREVDDNGMDLENSPL